jgi:hypothetical protein
LIAHFTSTQFVSGKCDVNIANSLLFSGKPVTTISGVAVIENCQKNLYSHRFVFRPPGGFGGWGMQMKSTPPYHTIERKWDLKTQAKLF